MARASWRQSGKLMFEREIDFFVKRDVDADQDGRVSKDEAAKWLEFEARLSQLAAEL